MVWVFEIKFHVALTAPKIDLNSPTIGGVSKGYAAGSLVTNQIQAVVFVRRPRKLRHLFVRVDADRTNGIDESQSHVNHMRACLSDDATGELVGPMLRLGCDVIHWVARKMRIPRKSPMVPALRISRALRNAG